MTTAMLKQINIGSTLAAGAPRLALLDLAAAPRALGAALALAHRALVLRSEALSAPLAV